MKLNRMKNSCLSSLCRRIPSHPINQQITIILVNGPLIARPKVSRCLFSGHNNFHTELILKTRFIVSFASAGGYFGHIEFEEEKRKSMTRPGRNESGGSAVQ